MLLLRILFYLFLYHGEYQMSTRNDFCAISSEIVLDGFDRCHRHHSNETECHRTKMREKVRTTNQVCFIRAIEFRLLQFLYFVFGKLFWLKYIRALNSACVYQFNVFSAIFLNFVYLSSFFPFFVHNIFCNPCKVVRTLFISHSLARFTLGNWSWISMSTHSFILIKCVLELKPNYTWLSL